MTDWISVEDRLPEENVPVLASNGESIFIFYWRFEVWKNKKTDTKVWLVKDDFNGDYRMEESPSHWMPLPPLPEMKDE